MNPGRSAATLLLSLALLAGPPARPALAAGPAVSGSGILAVGGAAAQFAVQVDGENPPYFDYLDFSGAAPREISLVQASEVSCLGELFGGQTIRLNGAALDSASGETLSLQVFLVDGGAGGQDRMSVKVARSDGKVVYFVPMRDLQSGDLSVTCPG